MAEKKTKVKAKAKTAAKSKIKGPLEFGEAFEKLTEKQKLFVSNYVGPYLYNATRAYMAVFPKTTYGSAGVESHKLLKNPKIKAAVDEISAKQFADIQSDIAKNETYRKIKALSEISIEEVVDLAGRTLVVKSLDEIPPHARYAIKSIKYDRKESETGMSENISVTFENKLNALKLLGEIQGLIDKDIDKQQVEIIVTPAQRPDRKKEKETEEDEE